MSLPTVHHWIAGKLFEAPAGRFSPVYDPALGVETKRVAIAETGEAKLAVASAKIDRKSVV